MCAIRSVTKPRTDKYSEAGHSRHYAAGETRRQQRTAKYRYVFLVGDKREVRAMKKQLNYPVFDKYPKGDSEHYSLENPMPFVDLNYLSITEEQNGRKKIEI